MHESPFNVVAMSSRLADLQELQLEIGTRPRPWALKNAVARAASTERWPAQRPPAQLVAFLRDYESFRELEIKTSHATEMPFLRLKVRIKRDCDHGAAQH